MLIRLNKVNIWHLLNILSTKLPWMQLDTSPRMNMSVCDQDDNKNKFPVLDGFRDRVHLFLGCWRWCLPQPHHHGIQLHHGTPWYPPLTPNLSYLCSLLPSTPSLPASTMWASSHSHCSSKKGLSSEQGWTSSRHKLLPMWIYLQKQQWSENPHQETAQNLQVKENT